MQTRDHHGRRAVTSLAVLVVGLLVVATPSSADEPADGGAHASIVDGEDAAENPQVVRLFVEWNDGSLSLCTGVFIDATWMLTAAHCLVAPDIQPIRAILESGSNRFHPTEPGYWSSSGRTYAVHPDYDPDDPVLARNDIAVVESFDPSPYDEPGVPYMTGDLEPEWGDPDAVGVLYGAGVIIPPDTRSDTLQLAVFETRPASTCSLVAMSAGAQFDSEDAICGEGHDPAGTADPQACDGDSGGPLLAAATDGRLAIAGILSGSVSAGECDDSTAYFVRAARHVEWISTVTGASTPLQIPPPEPPPPPEPEPTPAGSGYWLLEEDGDVTAFGRAPDLAGIVPASGASAVAIAARPQGDGFWVLTSDGDILAVGAAADFGAVDIATLTEPAEVVSTMSAAPDGAGLWVFTTGGRIIPFGSATPPALMKGSDTVLALDLDGPVIGSVATPSGDGAYLVAADGGVFAVGDAAFHGSVRGALTDLIGPPGLPAQPVVGVVADPDGDGYWMVAADGGVFGFRAPFRGSLPALVPFEALGGPINGMVPFGNGYLLIADDGGVFNFSDQPFSGSGSGALDSRVVGIAPVDG